ncbi:MAG: SPOR domain-containing protein, partial [Gammaproteobacteria bacterium]
ESVEPEEVALTLPVPSDDDQPRSQTIVLDNDREMPTPVPDIADETELEPDIDLPDPEEPVQSEPDSPVEPPVSEPPAAAVAAPSPSPPASGWYIQAGAYGDVDNARRQADRVSALGFDAMVSAFTSGGRTIQRVRIGPQQSRENAEAIASALSAHGFTVQVLSEE